jgi:hypothetical protein
VTADPLVVVDEPVKVRSHRRPHVGGHGRRAFVHGVNGLG